MQSFSSAVYFDCFTSRVSVEREKHVLSLPMLINQRVGHHHASDVNAVIHWYGQNTGCSRSSDAYDVKQVLKTLKSAFMLLLVQKEQHSLFNHTSLFQTFERHYYRHLDNRSTRDAPNVRLHKLWLKRRPNKLYRTMTWHDKIVAHTNAANVSTVWKYLKLYEKDAKLITSTKHQDCLALHLMSPMRRGRVVVAGYRMMNEITKRPQTISKQTAECYVF